MRKWVIAAVFALALLPASARADWLFTPNAGTTFGGAASGNEHFTYGASIGWMGEGIRGSVRMRAVCKISRANSRRRCEWPARHYASLTYARDCAGRRR